MGADQQFCLRWNNFHTNITSAFESLRDDEDFVDITLACEGRQIKAHKMVLSACSPYFRTLLRQVNPCQHPIVFLKDVSFANLSSILDFMYHGEVNVSHNELATFLKTAEALRVRGLAEDEKKRDGELGTESGSPLPPREPPEQSPPGVRSEEHSQGGAESRLASSDSDLAPPAKRQRSGGTIHEPTSLSNTTTSCNNIINCNSSINNASISGNPDTHPTTSEANVRENVKNEPEDYSNDDDVSSQQQPALGPDDIKLDGFSAANEGNSSNISDYNLPGDVSITSRNQAAMQQLQDTFSTFIPGMTANSSSFLSQHSSAERSHSYGIDGLPPGISSLPGPSLSQAGNSDTAGQGWLGDMVGLSGILQLHHHNNNQSSSIEVAERTQCSFCSRTFSNVYNLKVHVRDQHSGATIVECDVCKVKLKNLSTLRVHKSNYHIRCQTCGVYVLNHLALREHHATHHPYSLETANDPPLFHGLRWTSKSDEAVTLESKQS